MNQNEIPKETQEDLLNLQNLQRQMQMLVTQEQQLEVEKSLLTQALEELKKAEGKTYKNIGGIIIEQDKESLIKELEEKQEKVKQHLETLKKQEERIKKKANEVQERIEKALNKDKK